MEIESHPLPAFLPPHAKILMLGSFPPPKNRWKMDFYYPNFQNDMWRIFGLVFFSDRDYFIDRENKAFKEALLRDFLAEKGIAISDTARVVERGKGNASDAHLEVIEPIDLKGTLAQIPECHTIITTGELATKTLFSFFQNTKPPDVGSFVKVDFEGKTLTCYRMPSSSRAYPMPLEEKMKMYTTLFAEMHVLG